MCLQLGFNCSAFLLLELLGEHFRKDHLSDTSDPSSNPEQLELHPSNSNAHAHDVDAHMISCSGLLFNIGKNPDHFHGYPPPSPGGVCVCVWGGGAWLQMTSALEEHAASYHKLDNGRSLQYLQCLLTRITCMWIAS